MARISMWYDMTNAIRYERWTRLSPQWWSGRPTTVHIVLDLRSLIKLWVSNESCVIVHCITSHLASQWVFRCVRLTFSSISNRLAETWRRGFSTSGLWPGRTLRVWNRPIRQPAQGFILQHNTNISTTYLNKILSAPYCHIWSVSYLFYRSTKR